MLPLIHTSLAVNVSGIISPIFVGLTVLTNAQTERKKKADRTRYYI